MTYRIAGLDPAPFAPLWAMDADELAASGARRVTADADRGFPCRVTLEDARAGEQLLLVHHVHHDVAGPYRSAFAIFVREDAAKPAVYEDRCPPCFDGRTLSLRGFDGDGALAEARLAAPGEADAAIRALLADPRDCLYQCPQRRGRLLRRADRARRTMSIATIADDEAWAAVLRRDRALRRPLRHRRADHRHLLPPVVRRAPSRRASNVRFFADGEEAREAGLRPACAACPTTSPATSRRCCARSRRSRRPRRRCRWRSWPARRAIRRATSSACSPALTGLSPAAYARALREERAREALAEGESVTDAIYDAGFESASRFYDSMQGRLGMAPSAWVKGGAGATIRWAVVDSSLGPMLVAATDKGVCRLSFGRGREELERLFPNAELVEGGADFAALLQRVVAAVDDPASGRDIPVDVRGTAFQERVWQELRKIPPGETRSYAEIAAAAGNPQGGARGRLGQRREPRAGADPVPLRGPLGRLARRLCLRARDQAEAARTGRQSNEPGTPRPLSPPCTCRAIRCCSTISGTSAARRPSRRAGRRRSPPAATRWPRRRAFPTARASRSTCSSIAIRRIVAAVDIPVTADFEGGFAADPAHVAEHARLPRRDRRGRLQLRGPGDRRARACTRSPSRRGASPRWSRAACGSTRAPTCSCASCCRRRERQRPLAAGRGARARACLCRGRGAQLLRPRRQRPRPDRRDLRGLAAAGERDQARGARHRRARAERASRGSAGARGRGAGRWQRLTEEAKALYASD